MSSLKWPAVSAETDVVVRRPADPEDEARPEDRRSSRAEEDLHAPLRHSALDVARHADGEVVEAVVVEVAGGEGVAEGLLLFRDIRSGGLQQPEPAARRRESCAGGA